MTIIDKKLEQPLPCVCGSEIEYISIGYGRTPYGIHCHQCKLDLHQLAPAGLGGSIDNVITYWTAMIEAAEEIKVKYKTDNWKRFLSQYWYKRYMDALQDQDD